MSPAGGIGINLAIADAVAAAGILAPPLQTGRLTTRHLAAVSRRRALPTMALQSMQRALHTRLMAPALAGRDARPPAILLKLVSRVPQLSAIPAYLIGVGLLPQETPGFARR